MKGSILLLHWLAVPVVLALVRPAAAEDEIPLQALQNWKIYNNAGWAFLNRGRYDQAEDKFRRAIAEIRPYAKQDMRLMARSYADLARVLYHKGSYADAEPLATWALQVRESLPRVNPDAVFQGLYTLSLIHIAQDHFNKAEPLLRRALEIQEKAIGENHIQTAATVDELAGVCAQQRKFQEADVLYQRALSTFQRFNPDRNPDLAACAERYATVLDRMDRRDDAEKLRKRAKAIRDTIETTTALSKDSRPRPEFKGFK
jgi:tetratricopeptide (TPR) repeat protein